MEITSVEEYISYYMATNMMKEALGDGTEFELVYSTILEQVKEQASSIAAKDKSVSNIIPSNYDLSLDSLEMVMAGEESSAKATSPISLDLSSLNAILGGDNVVSSIMESINSNTSSTITSESDSADLAEIYQAVNKYAAKYNIDSNLILSIIKAESNFDSTATSSVGAQGLMQVMPSNLSAMGVTNGYDIEENINAGVKLLSTYLNQYNGNVEMALMAYNGGPGNMERRGVTSSSDLYKMPQETQNYVPKVLGYYKEFSA